VSVADDSGVWECLAMEHNSMHQLEIAVGAAHNMASRKHLSPKTNCCLFYVKSAHLLIASW